jgi:plasmid stability protein
MANLTVKDLPDAVYNELKEAARSSGRSLNGYVVTVLKATVEERNRRKVMREGREQFRQFVAALPRMEDSTSLIREDRDRGH